MKTPSDPPPPLDGEMIGRRRALAGLATAALPALWSCGGGSPAPSPVPPPPPPPPPPSSTSQWLLWGATNPSNGVVSLYKIRTDGSGFTQLSDGKMTYGAPEWSGDGGRVVFTGPDGRIWIANGDGAQPAALFTGSDASISYDGSLVALTQLTVVGSAPTSETLRSLLVGSSDGSSLSAVAFPAPPPSPPAGGAFVAIDWAVRPSFSRDAKSIAYAVVYAVDKTNPDGSIGVDSDTLTFVLGSNSGIGALATYPASNFTAFNRPRVSPDGSTVTFFDGGQAHLVAWSAANGVRTLYSVPTPTPYQASHVWSPDGTQIALSAYGHFEIVSSTGSLLAAVPLPLAASEQALLGGWVTGP